MKVLLSGLLLLLVIVSIIYLTRPSSEQAAPSVANNPPATEATSSPKDITAPSASNPPATATATATSEPVTVTAPPPAPHAFALFKDAVKPTVFELASGALVTWRDFAVYKPALVIFSTHPFLEPLRNEDLDLVRNLVRSATPAELVRRGMLKAADTAFTPPQTVSAAIEAGLIGEVVFVQPTLREKDQVSLGDFQRRAFNAGFLTDQEANALQIKDGVISGKVRGLPFRCVHPDALPKLKRPVIVHIDLGYYKDLYVNDIKTPLYSLLYETIQGVRQANWPVLCATLSYSNQEADFSLDTRFMISTMATLILHPEFLEGGAPPSWKMLADARYARAMFAETTANELTEQAVAVVPNDPDALYSLSQQKFILKNPDEAFALLDRAVAADPGYALAYLDLAETAVDSGRVQKAEELLNKAAKVFTKNPFVLILQADLLIRNNRGAEALPLLHKLQQLPWSSAYHPEIEGLLKQMQAAAGKQGT